MTTTETQSPRIDPKTIEQSFNLLSPAANFPKQWLDQPEDIQADLQWFAKHCADQGYEDAQAARCIDYDSSVLFRVRKGEYGGSYSNLSAAIRRYRKILGDRLSIQESQFVPNTNSALIFGAFNYALASNTITRILGPSGCSKTSSIREWRRRNEKRHTLLVEASELGGYRGLLRELCRALNVNFKQTELEIREQLHAAIKPNQIIIVDEAQFLLPQHRSPATALEFLRRLHDKTRCALALVASVRFGNDLEKSSYQFEQILGRIGLPVSLRDKFEADEVEPILQQYFKTPSKQTLATALLIASGALPHCHGRLRVLVEILRLASRMAAEEERRPSEEHFLKALRFRKQAMGGIIPEK